MSNALTVTTPGVVATLDNAKRLKEKLTAVKDLVAKDSTDAELEVFAEYCNRTRLDPFAKQIYFIKRGGKMSIQTSIDGFRLIASRTGKYRGQLGPFWCGQDGVWKDVWLAKEPPAAAKVGVLHAEFTEPAWAVARLDAYKQGTNQLWNTMADVMLAKCAESLALRKAFPNDLAGLYTTDEMAQSEYDAPQVHTGTGEVINHPASKALSTGITESQRKRLFAIAKDNAVSEATIKALMNAHFGIESTSQLTREQYELLCDKLIPDANPNKAIDAEIVE